MSLKTKLILLLLFFSTIPVLIIQYFVYDLVSQTLQDGLLFIDFIVITFAVLSAALVASTLTLPIAYLVALTRRYRGGELTERIDLPGGDEIGQLGREFNDMADKLNALQQALEEKVAQRTQELTQKVAELERLNRLMVGRELAMADLKKEIAELKKKL